MITTLELDAQKEAERVITAGTIIPQLRGAAYNNAIRKYHLGGDRDWINNLQDKGVYDGAMTVLDYKTGDVLAYVGSAGYYRDDGARTSSIPSTTLRASATASRDRPSSRWSTPRPSTSAR